MMIALYILLGTVLYLSVGFFITKILVRMAMKNGDYRYPPPRDEVVTTFVFWPFAFIFIGVETLGTKIYRSITEETEQ